MPGPWWPWRLKQPRSNKRPNKRPDKRPAMEPPVEARAEQARPGTSRTFFCILELGKWHQVASRHAGMPTVPGHVRNVYSECILGMYALSGIRYCRATGLGQLLFNLFEKARRYDRHSPPDELPRLLRVHPLARIHIHLLICVGAIFAHYKAVGSE
jgi:hypothetical protein